MPHDIHSGSRGKVDHTGRWMEVGEQGWCVCVGGEDAAAQVREGSRNRGYGRWGLAWGPGLSDRSYEERRRAIRMFSSFLNRADGTTKCDGGKRTGVGWRQEGYYYRRAWLDVHSRL